MSFLFCILFALRSGMGRRELYVESKFDGLPISVLERVPDGRPRAVVYLVHGLCGCKERFLPFIEYLTSNGFVCVASDHRGHGSSIRKEEDRGYMYGGGVQAVVADLDTVVDYIHEHFDSLPVFMLGHSMGSLAARAYAKHYDSRLEGLIVCGSPSSSLMAPLARMALMCMCWMGGNRLRVGYIQKFISGIYNRKFKQEGQQAWTCSDSEERRAIAEDVRCNFIITADCALTVMSLLHQVYSSNGWRPDKPGMPIIFLSGDDDPCMISHSAFSRSVESMHVNGYADVQVRTYPGMRHEILNEVNKQEVWNDILDYLASAYCKIKT